MSFLGVFVQVVQMDEHVAFAQIANLRQRLAVASEMLGHAIRVCERALSARPLMFVGRECVVYWYSI